MRRADSGQPWRGGPQPQGNPGGDEARRRAVRRRGSKKIRQRRGVLMMISFQGETRPRLTASRIYGVSSGLAKTSSSLLALLVVGLTHLTHAADAPAAIAPGFTVAPARIA